MPQRDNRKFPDSAAKNAGEKAGELLHGITESAGNSAKARQTPPRPQRRARMAGHGDSPAHASPSSDSYFELRLLNSGTISFIRFTIAMSSQERLRLKSSSVWRQMSA